MNTVETQTEINQTKREYMREYMKNRYWTDEEYRTKIKQKKKEQLLTEDKDMKEKKKNYMREYMKLYSRNRYANDEEYRNKIRERIYNARKASVEVND